MACVNFCKTNSLTGICNLSSMVRDCKIVEIPPKLIIKVERIVAQKGEKVDEISKQPRVISIKPFKKAAKLAGKRLKIGDSDVITTKKIAIIVPTEIMLSAESKTIEDKSVFGDKELSVICSFSLRVILRYIIPFIIAPKI